MVRFTAELAGIPIGITALYEQSRETFRDYLTEKAPVFSLEATEQDLIREYERVARIRGLNKQAKSINPSLLEEQWLYHQVEEHLPEYGAVLFHGSAIAVDGDAYLFTAPSGTGKSTHTRLWQQHFSGRALMVNDDKPLITFFKNTPLVCGSPWQGKHRLGNNICAPLRGICLLNRGSDNEISPISAEKAFPTLLQQCYMPEETNRMAFTLDFLERLSKCVPLYQLKCNMQPEAAQVAYMGMSNY